jgi:signal transduction histidine kinase
MDSVLPAQRLNRLPPLLRAILFVCLAVALAYLLAIALVGQVVVPHFVAPLPGAVDGRKIVVPLLARTAFWEPRKLLAVLVAMALPAVLLRRRPVLLLGLMLAESIAGTALLGGKAVLLFVLGVDVAVCLIAATGVRRTALFATGVALLVLAGDQATARVLFRQLPFGVPSAFAIGLTLVIALLAGIAIGQERDQRRALVAQATAQAVIAERLRIARELHDMVAHSIGIVAIQAGAGRRVIERQPEAAREALATIETTSRNTLSELRRMVTALRQAGPEPPETTPTLGLGDLDHLITTVGAAGVMVEVDWRGERRLLPPEIDRSAYRIIQEAVTNVVRHAGIDRCRVAVDYEQDEIGIEVVDEGRGGGSGAGFGIAGMRERATLLRGTFTAGPRAEGGFRVAARLPT